MFPRWEVIWVLEGRGKGHWKCREGPGQRAEVGRGELGSLLTEHGPQKGWWEGWGWLWRRAGRRGEAASVLGQRSILAPMAAPPTDAWEMSIEKISR